MKLLRKLAATSAAAVMMMAGGSMVAQADETPTVYNTPGGQVSGDRLWNTTCEMYSSDVVRCRAEIWASQVSYVNGRYVQKTGWTFNNLSYLPSPRASWEGNNLGQGNSRWNSGGKTWKTDCDTATTGQGGCRAYVWTKKVVAVKDGHAYKFENKEQWVFNNLVLFSSESVPAVDKVPAWIIDQSRLDFNGLGPLQVGASMSQLERLGYVRAGVDGACRFYEGSQSLQNRGVEVLNVENEAVSVVLDKGAVRTVDGAHVGMTVGELKGVYGDRLELVTKEGYDPVHTAVVESGGNELVFFSGFELDRPLVDSDVITMVIAREAAEWLGWDGC